MSARVVVLASGSGTLAQAMFDAVADRSLDVEIAGLGSDVVDAPVLGRARACGVATFTCAPAEFPDRTGWDAALLAHVERLDPDLVVSAGFMRLLGPTFVDAFPRRIINAHPALLPAFPGTHAVRDALAAGVKVTGCTVHFVDRGVDSGEIIAQRAVDVLPDDDVASLHERIKVVERELLVATVARLTEGGSQ